MEANRLVSMTGSVFSQAKLKIELPGAFGEGVGGIFAGQLEKLLIGIQNRSRTGDDGAVKTLRDQTDSAHEGGDVLVHLIGADPAPFELK